MPANDRAFGSVPGVAEGALFASRVEASKAGIHRPNQAGISGGASEGADSIVVSGGYEDDEDYGDVIIYTGHGGNDPETGRQIADQTLTRQNMALAVSCDRGLPVRVLRGADGDPSYSPTRGYEYSGLFYVEQYWKDKGRSGFDIWRYRLVKSPGPGSSINPEPGSPPSGNSERSYATVQRLVRNTAVTQWVKEVHDYECQVCGLRLETPSGPYAEGAHIRPRGRPHNGPDVAENVLCLCPNDHVRFDRGQILITDKLEILDSATGDADGFLHTRPGHQLGTEFLRYHRKHHSAA